MLRPRAQLSYRPGVILLLGSMLIPVAACNRPADEPVVPEAPDNEPNEGVGGVELTVEVSDGSAAAPPEEVAPRATLRIEPAFCTLTEGVFVEPSEGQIRMIATGDASTLYTYHAAADADEGEVRAWTVDTSTGCVLTSMDGFGDDGVADAPAGAETLVLLHGVLGVGAADYTMLSAEDGEETGSCGTDRLTRVRRAGEVAIALSGDEIQYFDLRPVGCMVHTLFEQDEALSMTFAFGAADDGIWGVATDGQSERHVIRMASDGSELWRWGEAEGDNSVNALSSFTELGDFGVVYDGTEVDLMLFELETGELLGRMGLRESMPDGFNRAKVLAIVPTGESTGLLLLQNFVEGMYTVNAVPFAVDRPAAEPPVQPSDTVPPTDLVPPTEPTAPTEPAEPTAPTEPTEP